MPRIKQAIHMVYSKTQKGYVLYDPTNKVFSINKDVTFRENIFPIESLSDQFSQLLPAPTNLLLDDSESSKVQILSELGKTEGNVHDYIGGGETTELTTSVVEPV